MPSSEITRQYIVAAAKELMRHKPLEKISTHAITDACGLNRNTFYYHFKDKYEILEQIFLRELEPELAPHMKPGTWSDSLVVLCEHMMREKEFYTNAFKSGRQGSFPAILLKYYKDFFINSAAGFYDQLGLTMESREMVARFYSHAVIGIICDWVEFGMKKDPAENAAIIRLVQSRKLFF